MTASFGSYLRAAYPCLWVNTLEPSRAEQVLGKVAIATKGDVAPLHWDIAQGLVNLGTGGVNPCPSPVEALKAAAKAPNGTTVFLWNFHRLLSGLETVQTVQNLVPTFKEKGNCIVVLAPSSEKLPEELARVFTTLEFALPTREELKSLLAHVGEPYQKELPPEPDGVLDSALGLTEMEAEDAAALALVETGQFDPSIIAREKAGALLRQAQLQVSSFTERFDGLGGLERLKKYALSAAQSPLSLGLLLLGPPGTGKSHFAKALGNELSRPTISLDFSRMMGSLVGQSEAAIRGALKAVDAMGKIVLFLDEAEKGLAGVQSSGHTDSGTKAGVAATFLKWASDRQPGQAYAIATVNDITQLPPEFTRAGRFDVIFWLDLPNQNEKEVIWDIYTRKFGVSGELPHDEGWTGAEIHSCCRTAVMLRCDLKAAAEYIIPVSTTMAEKIEALREWAKGRAVSASQPMPKPTGPRRLLTG